MSDLIGGQPVMSWHTVPIRQWRNIAMVAVIAARY